MKLTKSKLKQIIKEEFAQAIKEGEVVQGPWGKTKEDPGLAGGEELPAEYQHEYVLDELVDAARDGIMPLAVEKLKDAGAFSEETGIALTYNDIELEIEEPLLDALKPLAKLIQDKVDHAPDRETDEEEEW